MNIKKAVFVISNKNVKGCPAPSMPEFAFIGRSNVGKSSLINCLVGQAGLAKTSAKPGKTQLINHFLINDNWYLVDLPGYGYARTSKTTRAGFADIINEYIGGRSNLICLFVLIDSRLEPQKIDLHFIRWLGSNEIPFALVFTKTDKLKPARINENIETYKAELLKEWAQMPPYFLSSAEDGTGREEILNYIDVASKTF
jgi:GTP-binding protein